MRGGYIITITRKIEISGTVQGVGFRPFAYRLAVELGLAGSIRNTPAGVEILAQGTEARVAEFVQRLQVDAPPLARIRNVVVTAAPPIRNSAFLIESSDMAGALDADAARDTATCDACIAEMRAPGNRRHRHPFINCTDCGPRYTIIERLPYDRPNTSMKKFAMCPDCEREYNDPADRRFHAQPVCCYACGPVLRFCDADGNAMDSDDPIGDAVAALRRGKIVAIKGIGGFHLACNATSPTAVRRLRTRKHREEKPLAVMVCDLAAARAVAHLSKSEESLLESPERPIVLAEKKDEGILANEVAPRSRLHGLMLPYTPIHHLIAEQLPYVVMTSGNRTEEPIARTNEEALQDLRGIADFFLLHDRDILTRNDDSVVRHVAGDVVILRRSRGYVPEAIAVDENVDGLLACGPMLKNCVAVGRERLAYVSQHIGDLTNAEAYRSLKDAATKLCSMLGVKPLAAVCDRHPGYPSTRFAESLGVPVVRVQHHHAHIAACMAENGLRNTVIGVAFDGTGYGDDGHVWGSEVLLADRSGFERFAHLAYMRMPGGDAAVRSPGRMALGALFPLMGEDAVRAAPWLSAKEASAVLALLQRNLNCPLTSGMGRLFDAASAILDVCRRSTYEGQPAIELEAIAEPDVEDSYPVRLSEEAGVLCAEAAAILAAVVEDRDANTPTPVIAGRFHNTVVELLLQCATAARDRTGAQDVCLSGGCFQNALLLEKSVWRLEAAGFAVHRHRLVPPNDGGVALGQLVVAAANR